MRSNKNLKLIKRISFKLINILDLLTSILASRQDLTAEEINIYI